MPRLLSCKSRGSPRCNARGISFGTTRATASGKGCSAATNVLSRRWWPPTAAWATAPNPARSPIKQGDGDPKVHDWFYEATAAGVVMQTEILLAGRDRKAIEHYLPHLERACNCIEKTRDPKNNLFLVGPACNLLAPSYGGVKQPDGSFGKGYLAGLSITYLAALDRMVELYKLTGDKAKLAECQRRQEITRKSLAIAADARRLLRQVAGAQWHEARRGGTKEVRIPGGRGQCRRRRAPRGRRCDGPIHLSTNRGLPGHPALRFPLDQCAGVGRYVLELRKRQHDGLPSTSMAVGSTAGSGARSRDVRSWRTTG